MRIDRLLAITILMLNHERVTARELAEKFEVSIRTIYRDLEAMNMAGIPVVSYPGNNGGYGIMENYRLDRRLLTPQDIRAILSTLAGVNLTLADRSLAMAMEKIASLVPREQSSDVLQNLEQIVIDIIPWGGSRGHSEKIKCLHRAIAQRQIVEFSYINSTGEKSVRKVEPMTLIFKGFAWYLFGWCRCKDDYRFFRLSRIKDLKIFQLSFKRRDKSYVDSISIFTESEETIDLVLRFSRNVRQFLEDSFEEDQIEEQSDGSVIARFRMPENEWLYGFILSFGEQVEVISPEHIRRAVAEKAEKIFSFYKPDRVLS